MGPGPSAVFPPALSCGCRAIEHRRCDACPPEAPPFLTCSARCLQRHLDAHHPGAADARGRALAFQAEVNRLGTDARAPYEGHRGRLMRLAVAAQRAQGLCVLGAGNGNDLDLPLLVRAFGDVHLVDVDADALDRAVAGLPAPLRGRVTLHGGVDLSGCIDRLDEWGDALPDERALAAFATAAATKIARQIAATFDVVLSACLLSQLCHPFQNTLALAQRDWQRLFTAVTRMHLTTIALLVRPGGAGVIACDVLCHAGAAIEALRARVPPERLGEELLRAVATGKIAPEPDPQKLKAMLEGESFAELAERPFVTDPWSWDLGRTVQTVYGVVFRRP